jgi:signal transduction histidine kinase
VDPQDRSREQELLDKTSVLSDVELQLRRYDGSVIWVRDSVRSVRHDLEGMLYYDGSLVDITERKQWEKYLLRAERLAAMGQVAAMLAHEVKNPLQAIYGNLELARDFSLEPDEREECLLVCSQEVEQLIEITSRMLSFSRSERYTMRPVFLQQTWRQAIVLLSKPLQRAAIQVQSDFPEDLPPVLGIADQISQVLLNLVINATEVMPDGGLIRATAWVEGEQLFLSLVNNGPPIPDEHIEQIFDPFFTTKPDGSGLGLFISHNIVQQHGGRLRVENLSDEAGVCFTLTLPLAAVPGSSDSELPTSHANSVAVQAGSSAVAAEGFGL